MSNFIRCKVIGCKKEAVWFRLAVSGNVTCRYCEEHYPIMRQQMPGNWEMRAFGEAKK